MATHEALCEDVMTLVRHVGGELRRAQPDLFGREPHGAPKINEAVSAAKYELHAVRRILRALATTSFVQTDIDHPEVGDGYDDETWHEKWWHDYEHGETAVGKIDEDLRARVTADIHADARIAPIYKQLIGIALAVAFTGYAHDDFGVADHSEPSRVLNDLPIVFPRLELDGARATLELTMPLRDISSEHAYVAKWESRRREGLERVVRVYPMLFAIGRLFGFARSTGVQRLVVAGVEVRLDDDEAEARIVEQFWEPSGALWGKFDHEPTRAETAEDLWRTIVRAQLDFVRAASGRHPQFAARDALPYPRTLRAARSSAGRRPARYDE